MLGHGKGIGKSSYVYEKTWEFFEKTWEIILEISDVLFLARERWRRVGEKENSNVRVKV